MIFNLVIGCKNGTRYLNQSRCMVSVIYVILKKSPLHFIGYLDAVPNRCYPRDCIKRHIDNCK